MVFLYLREGFFLIFLGVTYAEFEEGVSHKSFGSSSYVSKLHKIFGRYSCILLLVLGRQIRRRQCCG
jgi:hypothetical protein